MLSPGLWFPLKIEHLVGTLDLFHLIWSEEWFVYIEIGLDPPIILKHYWYSTCKHLQECFDKMSRQGGFCGIFGIGNSKNISNLLESQPN